MKRFYVKAQSLLLTACVAGCTTQRGPQPLPDTPQEVARRAADLRFVEWNPSDYLVCDSAPSSPEGRCHRLNVVDWDRTTVCVAGTPTGSHITKRRCDSLREYLNRHPAATPDLGRHLRREWLVDPSLTTTHVVMRSAGATPPATTPSEERTPQDTESAGPLEVLVPGK